MIDVVRADLFVVTGGIFSLRKTAEKNFDSLTIYNT